MQQCLSNPTAISTVARTPYPAGSEGDTHSAMPNAAGTVLVRTDEDFSPGELVAAGEPKEPGDTWGFARIWNIADPASPAHLSNFATPHSLTNSTSGFYSVHNPADPREHALPELVLRRTADRGHLEPETTERGRLLPAQAHARPDRDLRQFRPGSQAPDPLRVGRAPARNRIYLSDINFGSTS